MTEQRFSRLIAAAVICCLGWGLPAFAQDPANVLLILNETSADSVRIANYYARRRNIPAENILRLRVSTADEIDRAEFERSVERPLAEWLARQGAQDRILYLVLTKGIPLRVTGTGPAGATTTASVDSELTLLYRKLVGNVVQPAGPSPNPYFLGEREIAEAKPFSHRASDIYLVSRLDGFTPEDVIKLIDRGAAPAASGVFVLDQRATLLGDRSGDTWLAEAAKRLTAAGFGDRVVLDSSTEVLTGQKQVFGYYSWGSNDPAIKVRRLGLEFVPGALAAMFVSSDARTFKSPPSSWTLGTWADTSTYFEGSPQSLTGDLIAEGATGAAGHVAEPYLGATVRPHILFPAYVSGFNLIESFYLAMPYLSWQTVIVGDPLCAPLRKTRLPADEANPAMDPDTELPGLYADRRLRLLESADFTRESAKMLLKIESRLNRGAREGIAELLKSPTATSSSPSNLVAFALLAERAEEFDTAATLYRATLTALPDNVTALNNLAYTLAVRQKNPKEALPLALEAYKRSMSAPQVADTVGWIHHLLGNDAEAEALLREAATRLPGSADIQLHFAVVLESRGQIEEARKSFERAVQLNPQLLESADARGLRTRLSR